MLRLWRLRQGVTHIWPTFLILWFFFFFLGYTPILYFTLQVNPSSTCTVFGRTARD